MNFLFEATAFAQEQDCLGRNRRQKVHYGCRHGATHTKVEHSYTPGHDRSNGFVQSLNG